MNDLKKTSLYETHINSGGTMVEFGGFMMPLYYTTIAEEHHAVRTNVGMFDVSHMGEIVIKGNDTLKFVNFLLTNQITVSDKMQYALMLNQDGGTIDDLMAYVFHDKHVLLVVNASNKDKDLNHIISLSQGYDVEIFDETEACAEIALQGPKSLEIIKNLFSEVPNESLQFELYKYNDQTVLISRSGYTGEDGFEIYSDPETIILIWNHLYKLGVKPCGLGCRDTLRFEAAMPLYGHELDLSINPIEAGLNFAIKFDKDDFMGKDALLTYKENPLRKIVGIELLERNVARANYEVYHQDEKIGYITTGYLSPTINLPIAMALIDVKYAKIGTELKVLIRNKYVNAIVRNKKFYDKKNKI